MKPVLAWVKANLVSVIAIVVAILALPAMLYFSAGWSAKLQEQVEQDVGGNMRELNQISVTYTAPTLDPSQPPISFNRVPNEATTQAIQSWLEQLRLEVDRINELALEANDPDREPLVDGLFPQPSGAESTSKRLEMARVWPGAMRELLRDAGADAPPDAAVVFDRLLSQYEVERQRLLGVEAAEDATLEPEDEQRIRAELGAERLRIYQDHAEGVRFYGAPSVIENIGSWEETRGAPSIEVCWEWQLRYWTLEDILEALAAANTDEAGQEQTVQYAPIKRIENISIQTWDLESIAGAVNQQPPTTANTSTEIPRNYSISPSGRTAYPAAPQNQLYDIRYVDLTLIADSTRIPQVLAAFPRTGLMSVVDLPIVETYDPTTDLPQGYYYGADPLVRLRLRVETIWMREWMAPFAPASVRAAMGIPNSWANPEPATPNAPETPPSPMQ